MGGEVFHDEIAKLYITALKQAISREVAWLKASALQ